MRGAQRQPRVVHWTSLSAVILQLACGGLTLRFTCPALRSLSPFTVHTVRAASPGLEGTVVGAETRRAVEFAQLILEPGYRKA